MPRYTSVWDVRTMAQIVKEKMGNNSSTSLKELSLKLVFLLALSNATKVYIRPGSTGR